jgi:hypothetical protein
MKALGTKRWIAGVTALAFASAAGPVAAAAPTPCFNPDEIEAEQAVRYQAELMVLSDTCGDTTYRDFTVRNREIIIVYQHEMMDHFRRTTAQKPQAAFDTFITRIANELALRSGSERVQTVCDRSATFLAQAQTLDKDGFRHYVADLAATNAAGYRRCTK